MSSGKSATTPPEAATCIPILSFPHDNIRGPARRLELEAKEREQYGAGTLLLISSWRDHIKEPATPLPHPPGPQEMPKT